MRLTTGATLRFPLTALVLGIGLLAQTAAQASPLTAPVPPANFADTMLPSTTAAARPELAGTVLEDVITPFSFGGITGTVQNRVVRETVAGTLDFYWKVNVDPTSTGGSVSSFRLGNFGYDNLKDADWRLDGLGTVEPTIARLFSVANQPGGSINFLFKGDVDAGESSRFFFLHTDAIDYAKSATYDLTKPGTLGISSSYQTFAPVPEPSTYAMAGVGMLMMGAMLRRKGRSG